MANDGGAAFPREDYQSHDAPGQRGMTLRDYFAGHALAGLCAAMRDYSPSRLIHETTTADDAYALADAMIARREQQS